MISLDKYDSNQDINSDIEDLSKLNIGSKNFDNLIINIVQKYLYFFVTGNSDLDNKDLLSMKELIRNDISKMKSEFFDLKYKTKEGDIDTFKSFGFGDNQALSKIDNLGSFLYSSDCLLDVGPTCEIFKDIIFKVVNSKNKDEFNILELGSGSGILTLGGFIGANMISIDNIKGIGLEKGEKTIIHSDKILNELSITKGKVFILQKDIVNPSSYELISYLNSIDLVIAEIFSKNIPSFKYNKKFGKLIHNEKDIGEFNYKNEDSRYIDPYFEGLNLLNELFDIFKKSENGKNIIWPNPVKEELYINGEQSEIFLESIGKNINLRDIGDTFLPYEKIANLGAKRWH